MTISLPELSRLAELSEKATQGEFFARAGTGDGNGEAWTPAYLYCKPYMLGIQCVGNKPSDDFLFIAALVNFFRANQQALCEMAKDAEKRYRWLRQHRVPDVNHRLVWYLERYRPLDEFGLDDNIDAAIAAAPRDEKKKS